MVKKVGGSHFLCAVTFFFFEERFHLGGIEKQYLSVCVSFMKTEVIYKALEHISIDPKLSKNVQHAIIKFKKRG